MLMGLMVCKSLLLRNMEREKFGDKGTQRKDMRGASLGLFPLRALTVRSKSFEQPRAKQTLHQGNINRTAGPTVTEEP